MTPLVTNEGFFAAFLRALPWVAVALPLLAIAALAIALADLLFLMFGKRDNPVDSIPRVQAASLVIPNWNGRDLLERFVPSWLEAIVTTPEAR